MWEPSKFGGLEKILVSPQEIWAPDIVLQNKKVNVPGLVWPQ